VVLLVAALLSAGCGKKSEAPKPAPAPPPAAKPATPAAPPVQKPVSSAKAPGAPAVPAKPGTPGAPAVPAVPAKPGTPGAPAAPGAAATPATATTPGAPVAPGVPVQKPLSSVRAAGAQVPAGIDFSKRKDPFKPFAPPREVAAPAMKAQAARVRESDPNLLPIQSFETTRFKISGIIVGLKENRALVIDPKGKGYVVTQGMQIGNNNGIITRITASSIEVMETYREDTGRVVKRPVKLTLQKK
jgi:type IV pilus assembly protein PilP